MTDQHDSMERTARGILPIAHRVKDLRFVHLAEYVLVVNCAGIAVCAGFFRIWMLDHVPGVNGDEAWYGANALALLHGKLTWWATPSHLPLNPFYFIPTIVLHMLLPRSFALLRVTAVLSGLLALVVIFLMCRRAFGTLTAIVSTTLLSALPINIAYSRFGWDASQSLLMTALVVYSSLLVTQGGKSAERYARWGLLAYAAAIMVHPSNLFEGLFLIFSPVLRWGRSLRSAVARARLPAAGRMIPAALLVGVLINLAIMVASFPRAAGDVITHRAPESRAQLADFSARYLDLFSGATVYRYVAGSGTEPPLRVGQISVPLNLSELVTALSFCAAIVCLCTKIWLRGRNSPMDAALIIAWATGIAIFSFVAGPFAISPGHERYGIWLVVPGVLVVSRGLVAVCHGRRAQLAVLAGTGLVGWALLTGFYVNYFSFIRMTGGLSEQAFRTAPVEPKLQASNYIRDHRRIKTDGPTWIVTTEWWNYQPLRYLTVGDQSFEVLYPREAWVRPGFAGLLLSGRVWFVEFFQSEPDQRLKRRLTRERIPFDEHLIAGYSRKPILSIIHPHRQ